MLVQILGVLAALAAPAQAQPLTIYSSFPLQGASRPGSLDIVDAVKLALRDRDFRAGGFRLRYVSLDDSTAAAGQWDAAQTKRNARRAALDNSAIAYIGEFNSGATANSIQTLNEAGILQISPSNTARGLTRSGPGAEPGEPDRYYPAGNRHYGRVIPIDDTQAAAQVVLMRKRGVRKLFVLNDRESYGRGVAALTLRAARKAGVKIAGNASWNGRAASYRSLARRVRRSGADAVFTGGIVDNNAAQLYLDLYRAKRSLKLFAPDGMATVDFTREIPPDVQRKTTLTAPTVAPSALPPAGRAFYKRFQRQYKVRADEIDPYAVYAYAATDAALDAIEKGGDDRQAVVNAFFSTGQRNTVLGDYAIDDSGDTSLRLYGAYRALGGRLVFDRAVRP